MSSFLLKDVRIFDGENTIDNGSVLVENGKISKVSTSPISFDGTTYSKPGHTLLPGLIDTHVHANGADPVALPQALRFGVTTVCDMMNETFNIEKLRKQIKQEGHCADIKTTTYAATVDMGWPMFVVLASHDTPEVRKEIATWPQLDTPESGREYVRERVKEGVDYIKLMHESGHFIGTKLPMPSLDLQTAVIEEAHKHDLLTVAHATCMKDTLDILSCGVDGLTHTITDQPPTKELVAAYKKNNAHCNPTLAASASTTTEGAAMQEKFAHDPRVQHLIADREKENMCQCMAFAKDYGKEGNAFQSVRMLKEAGVLILM
jgi:imidazolonepropionase-like amidohydrolase